MTIGLTVDGAEFGGAEASLVNLVGAVSALEPAIRFVLVGHRCPALEALAERLPHVRADIVPGRRHAVDRVRDLRRLIKSNRLDILQLTLCNPLAGRAAQMAGITMGTPTIAVEQLVRPMSRPNMLAKSACSRLLVDHVAVGTQSGAEIERYSLLPPGSVRVIHNGVPSPEEREPVRPAVSQTGHQFVVGTVGRLEHQKGIDRLIPSLVELPDVHLVIVGSGADEAALRNQAADLKVSDRITFTGWIDQPGPVMRSFDAFVLASRNEAFPLTVVEAMLRGVPVVTTNVGSVSDAVIDGRTGWLVPPGRTEQIVDRVQQLISNRELGADVGRRARQHALENFTAASMARRYLAMWRRPRGRLGPTGIAARSRPGPSFEPDGDRRSGAQTHQGVVA